MREPDSSPSHQLLDRLRADRRRADNQIAVQTAGVPSAIASSVRRLSGSRPRTQSRNIRVARLSSATLQEYHEPTSFTTRAARQALAHSGSHGAGRPPQGRGQGHHRPGRRRAGLRHARAHCRGRHRGHQLRASRAIPMSMASNELKDAIIAKFKRDNGIELRAQRRSWCPAAPSRRSTTCAWRCSIRAMRSSSRRPTGCRIRTWSCWPTACRSCRSPAPNRATRSPRGSWRPSITPKTRLVLLNSPCNPTGAAYTRAELRALGEVLLEHPRIVIGTDDMYEKIFWDAGAVLQPADGRAGALRSHRSPSTASPRPTP